MKQFELVAVPLDYSLLVCESAWCIETRELPGTKETYVYHKEVCQKSCSVNEVYFSSIVAFYGAWSLDLSATSVVASGRRTVA